MKWLQISDTCISILFADSHGHEIYLNILKKMILFLCFLREKYLLQCEMCTKKCIIAKFNGR